MSTRGSASSSAASTITDVPEESASTSGATQHGMEAALSLIDLPGTWFDVTRTKLIDQMAGLKKKSPEAQLRFLQASTGQEVCLVSKLRGKTYKLKPDVSDQRAKCPTCSTNSERMCVWLKKLDVPYQDPKGVTKEYEIVSRLA
jgi:hypothetical protein